MIVLPGSVRTTVRMIGGSVRTVVNNTVRVEVVRMVTRRVVERVTGMVVVVMTGMKLVRVVVTTTVSASRVVVNEDTIVVGI